MRAPPVETGSRVIYLDVPEPASPLPADQILSQAFEEPPHILGIADPDREPAFRAPLIVEVPTPILMESSDPLHMLLAASLRRRG